tara:strand:- start:425 stop:604 length:180 start_codon:yes stop_codon:yes gene_type:complete
MKFQNEIQKHESLSGLKTMTNIRFLQTELSLNRFVASTKCNSTKTLISGLKSKRIESTG